QQSRSCNHPGRAARLNRHPEAILEGRPIMPDNVNVPFGNVRGPALLERRMAGDHCKRFLATAFGVLLSSATAMAQTYPSRPITMVVPFPAGGPTDTLARILSDHMSTSLAQSVIVENVSGAAGSIGLG